MHRRRDNGAELKVLRDINLNKALNSRTLCFVAVLAVGLVGIQRTAARAADPTFVGNLAFAVDEEGVKRLGLSDEVKQKLIELIDRREREALNIALQVKDLPPPERAARLAPFVAESERQGMALLTVGQRSILAKMRIARQGMSSLTRDEIARVLGLNEEQQTKIQTLLTQRNAALGKGGEGVGTDVESHVCFGDAGDLRGRGSCYGIHDERHPSCRGSSARTSPGTAAR